MKYIIEDAELNEIKNSSRIDGYREGVRDSLSGDLKGFDYNGKYIHYRDDSEIEEYYQKSQKRKMFFAKFLACNKDTKIEVLEKLGLVEWT